jgi:hypothetical protein
LTKIDEKYHKKMGGIFEQQVTTSGEIYAKSTNLETTEIELKFYDYDEI